MQRILLVLLFFAVSCASNSKRDANNTVFIKQPMEKVKLVLESAYQDLGFQYQGFREDQCGVGNRPVKWGLFRSVGGESVEVCLQTKEAGTEVYCTTKYSFGNYMNQEDWDSRFLNKIKKLSSL